MEQYTIEYRIFDTKGRIIIQKVRDFEAVHDIAAVNAIETLLKLVGTNRCKICSRDITFDRALVSDVCEDCQVEFRGLAS